MALSERRDLDALRPRVELWLGNEVVELTRPAPGWSCETLLVDRATVLRLPPLGDGIFPQYDLQQQAAAQQALADAGVPVAAPCRYESDDTYLGTPFVAMPFVAGHIPADFTPMDLWLDALPDDAARRQVWRSFLETVTQIHAVPISGLGLRDGVKAELAYWDEYVEWACDGEPPGALRAVLRWCDEHQPDTVPPSGMLWGDVRLGNVIFDEVGRAPRAVLDFDMVSAGPIELDIAWYLALETLQTDLSGRRVAGFGERDESIALVEGIVGRLLLDLEWYEVFSLARASAVSTRIATLFARHGERPMFAVGDDPALAAAQRRIEAW